MLNYDELWLGHYTTYQGLETRFHKYEPDSLCCATMAPAGMDGDP